MTGFLVGIPVPWILGVIGMFLVISCEMGVSRDYSIDIRRESVWNPCTTHILKRLCWTTWSVHFSFHHSLLS